MRKALLVHGLGERPSRPLRFGLMVDSTRLAAWQHDALAWLRESGVADLELLVINAAPSPKPRAQQHWAYRLYRRTEARPTSWRTVEAGPHLDAVPRMTVAPIADGGGWQRFPDDAVAAVRDRELDFLLLFGFGPVRGGILEATRYGVWAFQYGAGAGHRDDLAGFWEVLRGEQTLDVALYRRSESSDGGPVLQSGRFKVDAWSLSSTLDRAYHGSLMFPALACRDILTGSVDRPAAPGVVIDDSADQIPDARLVLKVLGRIWTARARQNQRRLTLEDDWRIAIGPAPSGRVDASTMRQLRWVELPPEGFFADPFLVPGTEGRVVVCERMDFGKGLGVIDRLEVGEAEGPVRADPLIADEPGHMSYPFLFHHGDHLLCVPERAAAGDLVAYRLTQDARHVLDTTVLVEGLGAADPTLVHHGGRYWLFFTLAGEGENTHLFLFHAPALEGPWQPHAQNPIVIDIGGARPAGRPFLIGGRLHRPAQDCTHRYGGAVAVYRIDEMTPSSYRETLVERVEPVAGSPAPDGIHTVCLEDGWITVDGVRERFTVMAGFNRVRSKIVERRARR